MLALAARHEGKWYHLASLLGPSRPSRQLKHGFVAAFLESDRTGSPSKRPSIA